MRSLLLCEHPWRDISSRHSLHLPVTCYFSFDLFSCYILSTILISPFHFLRLNLLMICHLCHRYKYSAHLILRYLITPINNVTKNTNYEASYYVSSEALKFFSLGFKYSVHINPPPKYKWGQISLRIWNMQTILHTVIKMYKYLPLRAWGDTTKNIKLIIGKFLSDVVT